MSEVDAVVSEANAGHWWGGRKLTFRDKCGAFAALYSGAKPAIVARAFKLHPTSVSRLSGCLDIDPHPYRLRYDPGELKANRGVYELTPMRPVLIGRKGSDDPAELGHNKSRSRSRKLYYQDVAREFGRLGRDQFNYRYFTPSVAQRILDASHDLLAERGLAVFK